MKLSRILAVAACISLYSASAFGQSQTFHAGSLMVGSGANTMQINAPSGGGASTFTFPNASLTWPSSNASGVLKNDGSGNLSWGSLSGLTLPYNSGPQSASSGNALFTLTNNGAGLGVMVFQNGTFGVGVQGQASGVGAIGVAGYGNGGGGSAGVYASCVTGYSLWANVSGTSGGIPINITNSNTGAAPDISSNNWSISNAGVFSGTSTNLALPYGPSASSASGLFTITNSNAGAASYAVGGQATGGGIGVVAASTSTGAALQAQNTSSGIAIAATASGTGPVIKASATSTNDAIDAYGNVQVLGTGAGGTGGPTNASVYIPYGDITVGNHILTTDASGVGSVVQNSNTNLTLSATGVGTDAAGRITLVSGAGGTYSASITVTYAAAYAAGSYPVVVLTPNAATATTAQLTSESNTGFTFSVAGSDAGTVQTVKVNYMVMGQNH